MLLMQDRQYVAYDKTSPGLRGLVAKSVVIYENILALILSVC